MTAVLITAMLLAGSRLRLSVVGGIGATLMMLGWSLPAAVAIAATAGYRRLLRLAGARRQRQERLAEDRAMLADLTALGLTGGLGVRQSLEIAAGAVGGEVAGEVSIVLRAAQIDGTIAAMLRSGGAGRDLYQVIARALQSGAPLHDQVGRVADDLHAALTARRLERVRQVPVTMLFPLTLLILPGFLLLTVAPAILDAFGRLEL